MMAVDKEESVGIKALTDIIINRTGINYDDMLLARTCRRCGRLILGGTSKDIRDEDSFKIVLKAPGIGTELTGAEILCVSCECEAYYTIILYEPVSYYCAGIMAYTIIQLDGVSKRHKNKKACCENVSNLEEWVAETLAGKYNEIVKIVNRSGISLVEEDWSEARYSTGWVYK